MTEKGRWMKRGGLSWVVERLDHPGTGEVESQSRGMSEVVVLSL